jgi:small subunit ribosomal protein S17
MKGERADRRMLEGKVVSDKMDKTVVVEISRLARHPVYNKRITRTAKVKAHDEKNECRMGDRVRLMETRPMSREKRWRVAEIVERASI